jgi:hypothetical protein
MYWLSPARVTAFLLLGGVFPIRSASAQEHENVEARERAYRLQRAYPHKDIPTSALQRVVRWRMGNSAGMVPSMLRQPSGAVRVSADVLAVGAQWTPVGPWGAVTISDFGSAPQPDAGRITDVAFDPSHPDVLYVAAASGGIWKTTSAGATWAPLTDGQCSLNIGAMAMDPVNSSILYVGTGELNAFRFGCGVLRSVDAGSSWQPLATAELGPESGSTSAIGSVYVDPATAGSTSSTVVLVASTSGIFRSANSGQSWTSTYTQWTTSLVASGRDPNVLFAGVAEVGLVRSADKGLAWSTLPLPSGLAANQILRIQLATSLAAPGKVWMAVANFQRHLQGLWMWDDDAQSWTQLAANGLYDANRRLNFGDQAEYDLVLAVDPRDASRLYLGGVRLYRSVDGGDHFTQIATNVHVDWHAFRIDPSNPLHLVGGNDGGVFISNDGGDSWFGRNAGLAIAQFYPGISVHPTLHSYLVGGVQDNGVLFSDGLPLWEALLSGDGGFTAFDPSGTLFLEAQWNAGGAGPAIGRISGASYQDVNAGIDATDRADNIPPLVMHPTQSQTLYFGTQRLYRTTDGTNWHQISTSSDLSKGSGSITRIALAASDPDTVYIGTSDGLVRMSADAGVNFATVGAGFPDRYVTGIAVDPSNAAHVVAVVSGFGTGHVWESTDAGATWSSLDGTSIPDIPADAVTMVPGTSDVIVGTDVGVWLSPDFGATWQAAPAGLPNVEVNDVVYDPMTQRLLIASYGRGMWAIPVVAPLAVLRGDLDLNGSVDAQDALLIGLALVGRGVGQTTQSTPVQILPNGDANCNGQLDTGDAVAVLRQAVGLTTTGSCVGVSRSVRRAVAAPLRSRQR